MDDISAKLNHLYRFLNSLEQKVDLLAPYVRSREFDFPPPPSESDDEYEGDVLDAELCYRAKKFKIETGGVSSLSSIAEIHLDSIYSRAISVDKKINRLTSYYRSKDPNFPFSGEGQDECDTRSEVLDADDGVETVSSEGEGEFDCDFDSDALSEIVDADDPFDTVSSMGEDESEWDVDSDINADLDLDVMDAEDAVDNKADM